MHRLAPCLFGLLAYAVIRLHSHAPASTLPMLAWWLLGLGVGLFALLWLGGRRLSVSRPVGWLLLAITASMIASNVLLSDLFWSLPLLGVYVADVLLALAVYLMYRDERVIPLHAYCIVIGLVHVPYLVEAVLWVAHAGPDFFRKSMRIANFSHVRQFGEMGFVAAISGSALLVSSRRLGVLSFLLATGAVFGMVLTGSRGALLCWMLFVALLFACFPARRRRIASHAVVTLAGTAAVVGALHYSGLLVSPNIFVRIGTIVDGDAGFDSGRLGLWLGALREIAARPLFGLGTEAYQLSGCCDRTLAQPHNFVLQLLMQFGIVGNALFLALGWRAIRYLGGTRALLVRARAAPEGAVLASMIVAYLAYGFIDGLLYHPAPLLHFALFCGLFAATLRPAPLSGSMAPDQRGL
jgi:O-antigen ligase